MDSHEWELEVLPRDAAAEIRKTPSNNRYDSRLLLIAENWIRWLHRISPLEVGEPSPENPWPFALTRLDHLIIRCHNRIYEHYANYLCNGRIGHVPTDDADNFLAIIEGSGAEDPFQEGQAGVGEEGTEAEDEDEVFTSYLEYTYLG
ncbi:hypothetical protein O1611_g7232 [Lasiodiplodia mahajangana]|uniref:Uncharacterized protein n=1 Tax=Lasiodiplodia mahajangana TaxID=1108764 RepID=A0ACC2JG69_9PEZI|nr:hypothetical protein O1611_g7232 [Lasiodiplodia mahajangana]